MSGRATAGPMPIRVGACVIPVAAIAAEAQHHPSADGAEAWQAAAEALVIRQLLLDEAARRNIVATETRDAEGHVMTDDDARIDALLDQAVRPVPADEAACRSYYDRHPKLFATPMRIEASHILLGADPDDALAMGLALNDARALLRRLNEDPTCFAALARDHSACPSRADGGALGPVAPGQMVPPFEEALFALGENAMCPHPVRTVLGVHVIRAGRRIAGRMQPFEIVQPAIADYLDEGRYRQAVAAFIAGLAEAAGGHGIQLLAGTAVEEPGKRRKA